MGGNVILSEITIEIVSLLIRLIVNMSLYLE